MNNIANGNEMSFQVLIEEDKVQGDFIAYIPAVRLGVHGDTIDEVRANAKELLQLEIQSRLQQGKSLPSDNLAWVEQITIEIPLQLNK
ncbi:type II toxin-antitoxin system HicB family antitoxin [Cohnella soli]|uniref:Type II toxin-antitoxin system HicB family antitoxin n=1 Tax=Cohnella soli TaxID=425005 RepID=A0ABW0HP87_9BACL